ncbi:MAG: heme NO-binding domain-containing protein, partial [Chloroflexota bacterium]
KADISTDEFLSMEQYPDADSVALVVATAEIQDRDPAAVLEEIGEYWIEFALNSHYGDLLRISGDTLPEILMNLNNLHERIGQAFPNLDPPSFWCTDVAENSLTLHYVSNRAGLTPMVAGLIKGLSNMLNASCTVTQTVALADGAHHDEFLVTF